MEKVAETKAVKARVQDNVKAEAKKAKDDAAFKAKKAEAAKAFAARQKERKENLVKCAKELIEKKLLERLSPEAQKFFTDAANPVAHAGGFGGATFLNKVFGDNPKVGDSVTLKDYMMKTFKSKSELDKRVKEWAEKGIVVEVKDAPNALDITYTIKKI